MGVTQQLFVDEKTSAEDSSALSCRSNTNLIFVCLCLLFACCAVGGNRDGGYNQYRNNYTPSSGIYGMPNQGPVGGGSGIPGGLQQGGTGAGRGGLQGPNAQAAAIVATNFPNATNGKLTWITICTK